MADFLGPANARNAVTERPTDDRAFSTLDSWFRDCSSPKIDDGTAFRASFFNGMIAACRSLWRANGLRNDGVLRVVAEDGTDDNGLTKSIQQLIQRSQQTYAVDTGDENELVISLSPALIEYKAGLVLRVKVANSTTGPATINVNGLGDKDIVHPNGAPIGADAMIEGGVALLIYDGENFQLAASHTDLVGEGGGGSLYRCPLVDATGTAAAITATYSPATATPVKGDFFAVRLTAAIVAGGTTFAPDGHGPYPMVDSDNVALAAGFAANGSQLLMQYDGAKMRVMNRPPQSSGASYPVFPAIGSYYCKFNNAPISGATENSVAALPIHWPWGSGTPLPGSWKIICNDQIPLYLYGTIEGGYAFTPSVAVFAQRVA